MKPQFLLVAALGLVVAADEPGKGDGKKLSPDLKQMQGTWRVILVEFGGKKATKEENEKVNFRLVVEGERYTVYLNDEKFTSGRMKLDPAKKPKEMDTREEEGPNKGKTLQSIYKIEGDVMMACFNVPGGQRPTEFKTEEGSEQMLLKYERVRKKK